MSNSGDDTDKMNPNDAKKKVVEFAPRPITATGSINRAREILNATCGAALVPLLKLVAGVFDSVDDSLFDLSDKALDANTQQQFFEGMREVRRRRADIEKSFQDRTRAAFSDYSAGKTLKRSDERKVEGELSLSLVDDSKLEEGLALASMTSRADTRFGSLLFTLSQRCAALVPKQKPEDLTPLSPRLLCDTLEDATKDLLVNLDIKLIILKLFERKVIDELETVYIEANRVLVEAGVLPHLKYSLPKHTRGTGGGAARVPGPMVAGEEGDAGPGGPAGAGYPGGGFPGGAAGYPGGGYPGGAAGFAGYPGGGYPGGAAGGFGDGEFAGEFQQLASLLSQRRQAVYGPDSALAGIPVVAADQLLSALSLLQDELIAASSATLVPGGGAVSPSVLANQVKQSLLSQTQKQAGVSTQRINAADEDAIDLVGMLFDFVLSDRNLPARVQATLARLQIPYLRVALLDRHLFSQKTHPARKLLDEMAQACVGWTEDADRDGKMIGKVTEIVESLLKDFGDDIGVFDRLSEDFQAFLAQHKRRAEIAEQRAAEAAQGREKLESARLASTRAVHGRTAKRALPEVVREIITGPWSKYLELTHARKGGDSPEWATALKFMDDLLWSVDIRQIAADEDRWHALKPELETSLEQGLQVVAYHPEDMQRLLSRLRGLYTSIAEGAQPEPPPVAELDTASLGAADGIEITQGHEGAAIDAVAQAEGAEPEGPVTAVNEHVIAVRQLKVGTWVEFAGERDSRVRAKLSWVSPISEKYLFVNQNGVKITEKSIYDLAADVKEGRATILHQAPLFDRALDAIMKRLRSPLAPKAPAAEAVPKPA